MLDPLQALSDIVARAAVAALGARTLAEGLALLGIAAPERM